MTIRTDGHRRFAIVTGASTGIGLELAKCCAEDGYDLLIAADESEIEAAAEELRRSGGKVETLETDLSTTEGVDELIEAVAGRPVDALLANAGRGLGKALLLHLARLANQRDYGRMEWSVLDWNQTAIDFYEALGARRLREWQICRLSGAALSRYR